ncbi:hypothetical protein B0H12DRAFT_1076857 [Mycena haematopus]|nr:hypothetical protein B0H12DRAFT_1076857 [Mycena haematopus]
MAPSIIPGVEIARLWVMFFFETLFTVFMTIAAWNMFGSGWGDPSVLLQLNWTWGALPLLSGIHSGMAQGFYIWRIWHLTKQLWLPVPIALAVLTQLAGLYWFSIKWNIGRWHVSVLPPLSGAVSVWLIGSAVCDVLITLALTSVLWRRKRETKFAETSGLLNRLIRLSIETGALTSVTATVEGILWLGWERFNYHFALFLILGKLYSNVLMATLNCRNPGFLKGTSQGLVDGVASTVQLAMANPPLQPAFWCEPNDRRTSGVNPALAGGVHVSRNIYVDHPSDPIIMTNFNIASTPRDVKEGSIDTF